MKNKIQILSFKNLLLLIIIFYIVLLIFFVSKNYFTTKKLLFEQYLQNINTKNIENSYLFINTLNNQLKTAENITNISSNIFQIPTSQRRDYFKKLLYNIISSNEEISAIWIIFKPNILDSLDYLYQDKLHNITGQFVYNLFKTGEKINEKEIIYADYYKLTNTILKFEQKPSIINFSIKNAYTSFENSYLIQILAPIKANNTIIGTIGIEISTTFLDRLYKKQKIFITDKDNKILYSTNYQTINKNLNNIYELPENFTQQKKLNSFITLKNNNEKLIMTFKKFTFNGEEMFFLTVENENLPKQSQNLLIQIILILLASSTIFISSILFINKNLNKLNTSIINIKIGKQIQDNPESNLNELNKIIGELKNLEKAIINSKNYLKNLIENNLNFEIDENEFAINKEINQLKQKINEETKIKLAQERVQKKESEINRALNEINRLQILYINDLETLVYEIIKYIADYSNALQGGFYIIEEDALGNKTISLKAFISYNRRVFVRKNIEFGEGLVGSCALEKKPIITKIPKNYLEIQSGFGSIPPEELYIVPLIHTNETLGVIELAFSKKVSEEIIEFINKAANLISNALYSSETTFKTQKLLEETEKIKRVLETKEKQLQEQITSLEKFKKRSEELEIENLSITSSLQKFLFYISLDTNLNILEINENLANKLQIKLIDATLLNFYDLFFIYDRQKYNNYFQEVLKGKTAYFELFVDLGINSFYVDCVAGPIYSPDGKISKLLILGKETTEIKEKNNKIKELESKITELLEKEKVQEAEINFLINDYQFLQDEVTRKDQEIKQKEQEFEKLTASHEFLQKEFQKRMTHFAKIETNLKEKIKQLEEEIEKLKKN